MLLRVLALGAAFGLSLAAHADNRSLLDSLRADQARLDALTGTTVSLNRVSLMHLGKNSLPTRLELIRNAQKFVFVSVPYWYGDQSGETVFSALAQRRKQNPDLDLRVLEDWTSPGSTGDLFAHRMFRRLREITGDQAQLWNSPYWGRNFSLKLLKNRLHDKLFIVDGDKLVMGGMNIGDSYLRGGMDRKGWHDTDMLIEGPAAAIAGRLFVKLWEFSRYLSDPANAFPKNEEERRRSFTEYLYHDREVFNFVKGRSFLSPGRRKVAYIPFTGQLKSLGIDQARDVPAQEGGVPVRIVYDNPLFNQAVRKGEPPYCHFQCVLDFLLERTRESVRLFSPYLTITEEQEELLVKAARRGLRVEIITNSRTSHDLGNLAYLAAVSHYLPLLEAGARIYEWQGHRPLEELEERAGCRIPDREFPGKTTHTKGVILDGQVGILGSNNMNVRSELYNSEVMAVVQDPGFAGQLNDVFEHDLDADPRRTIQCGNKMLPRPRRVREVQIEPIREFVRKNKFLLDLARVFEKVI